MNSDSNSPVPAVQSSLASKIGFALMCAVGGLAGGALAYPIFVGNPFKPVSAPVPEGEVMLRAVPDPARGVTCYVSHLGGVSCVPDQWFTPPPAALKQQVAPSTSRGWDL